MTFKLKPLPLVVVGEGWEASGAQKQRDADLVILERDYVPIIEWVAAIPCTLLNCKGGKHHPACVPGQAQRILAQLRQEEKP